MRTRPMSVASSLRITSDEEALCEYPVERGREVPICQRLKKECTPAPNVRKRKPKTQTSTSKRARIEEKLDDLVSLLQSQNAAKALTDLGGSGRTNVSSPASHSWPPPASVDADGELSCTGSGLPAAGLPPCPMPGPEVSGLRGSGLPPHNASSYDTPESLTDAADIGGLSYAEAEVVLQTFRTKRLRHFPILYLPPEMTAQDLWRERPFLWLVVRAVCSRSVKEQNVLADRIRQTIARRTIVDCDCDLDMLQGLLVFLGWCAYFSYGKPFLCTMCNMAISVAFDLRITRPAREDMIAHPYMNCFTAYTWRHGPKGVNIPPPSNETRRALLACFIICTNICSFMKFDVVQWSPPLSDCMTKLAESRETPADEVLIALAKIAKVSEDVSRQFKGPEDREKTAPPYILVKAFLDSLQQVKEGFSPEVLQNDVVITNIRSTRILIYELAISHQPPSVYSGLEYRRIEYLHACLQATKSYLDNFRVLDAASIPMCCSSILFHFACTMKVLYRLLLLEDPGWDRVAARKEADIVYYLEQSAAKFEQAHQVAGIDNADSEGDLFKRAGAALRLTMPTWRAALDQISGEAGVLLGVVE
ncbi:Zn2/Cys6 DNA-binding protein [Apiospora rasikravindrae]|uniref:Zn2/Cys6 DNA-binding protein n=1 Tax=Apiospora rasikravindrae TaxID=990691 RepID=A0ABR1RRY4_9PEZI